MQTSVFPNIAPYFPKYQRSQIKFVAIRIWVGGRHKHRYILVTPFS